MRAFAEEYVSTITEKGEQAMFSRINNAMWLYCVVYVMLYAGQACADNIATGTSCHVGYIPKFKSGTSITDSIICESSDKIGIGISNPTYKLDLAGGMFRIGDRGDSFGGLSFDPAAGKSMHLYTNSSGTFYVHNPQIQSGIFFIKADGIVGIGASAPSEKLTVHGNMLRVLI
jgi:hypothetical protein